MNEKNKNMISKKELLVMGKNSYLINVSRGGLINEEDLYEALNSNLIKGAALDVFATEPYEGKLLDCKKSNCNTTCSIVNRICSRPNGTKGLRKFN